MPPWLDSIAHAVGVVVLLAISLLAVMLAGVWFLAYLKQCRWYWGVIMEQRREWRGCTFAERREILNQWKYVPNVKRRGRRNRWLKRNQWALPAVVAWTVLAHMLKRK